MCRSYLFVFDMVIDFFTEVKRWLTVRGNHNFDIRERHRDFSADRFYEGFLGSKPDGKGGIRILFSVAIGNFLFGKYPPQKPLPPSLCNGSHTVNMDNIDANPVSHQYIICFPLTHMQVKMWQLYSKNIIKHNIPKTKFFLTSIYPINIIKKN